MPRNVPSPRRLLFAAIVALLVLTILPAKYTRFLGWFEGPIKTVLTPISHPATLVSTWLRPAVEFERDRELSTAELERQRDQLAAELRYALSRIRRLENVVKDLQSGIPLMGDLPLRRLHALRVGTNLAAGTIDVKRGRNDGVIEQSIAVVGDYSQMVGIVTHVGPQVSTVHLITDERLVPNLLEVDLLPAGAVSTEDLLNPPHCQVRPIGDGTLVADSVGFDPDNPIQPGDMARLHDPSWPDSAQMLLIGRVEQVEPKLDPLFVRVIVRPEIDPSRVRSVILRIPVEDAEDAAP